MGVQGLWELIGPVGHPVELDSLSNKVLAIDISIWLNQSIKGIRDKTGRLRDNAHILGLFNRICKLLFYKIKPVFVFDGGVPELKKRTIALRNNQRLKAITKSKNAAKKVLETYLAESKVNVDLDNFKVPDLASSLLESGFRKYDDDLYKLPEVKKDQDLSHSSDDDHGLDDYVRVEINHKYYKDLEIIDYESKEFNTLPPDIRHELLTEMKQRYKSWRQTDDHLPKESNDFSEFQLKRLLKKRKLQAKIEETEVELNTNATTSIMQNFKNIKTLGHVETGRLLSDQNTQFIFIKKINKASQESYSQTCSQNTSDTHATDKDTNKDTQETIIEIDHETITDSQEIVSDKSHENSQNENISTQSSIKSNKFKEFESNIDQEYNQILNESSVSDHDNNDDYDSDYNKILKSVNVRNEIISDEQDSNTNDSVTLISTEESNSKNDEILIINEEELKVSENEVKKSKISYLKFSF